MKTQYMFVDLKAAVAAQPELAPKKLEDGTVLTYEPRMSSSPALVVKGAAAGAIFDNDLVGWIARDDDYTVDLYENVQNPDGSKGIGIVPKCRVRFSFDELKEFEVPAPEWKQWIHYFGVKARVADNYWEFKRALKNDLKAEIENLPEWR